MGDKPRILHCPIVALYQPYLHVKGLRELGYRADYMVFNFDQFKWLARDCDYDLSLDGLKGIEIEKTREVEFFLHALDHYDVFHFHSGYGLLYQSYSLWDRLDELRFLKKLGKKIVMSWWGCGDVRKPGDMTFNRYGICDVCVPNIKNYCGSGEKEEIIKKAFKYVDVHLSAGDLVMSYDSIRWIDNAIDCEEWRPFHNNEIPERFRLPETGNFKIYHSFGRNEGRGEVKGTKHIREAVERLASEGYKVELLFFDKIPNKDLKYYQAQADIVVDQLRYGWYGSTGVECLSMGKPVITCINPDIEAIAPHSHPLINASIENIYEVLKDLLKNRDKISKIGEQSRRYALKYHHYLHIAQKLASIYH